ncbi:hypothetical protein AVEN_184651-1, partial [Araneus ventricosus]
SRNAQRSNKLSTRTLIPLSEILEM